MQLYNEGMHKVDAMVSRGAHFLSNSFMTLVIQDYII